MFASAQGFDQYIFGDAFIHAFHTVFEVIPLKRVGFAVADHRFYEKNGCDGSGGIGPFGNLEDMEETDGKMKTSKGGSRLDMELSDAVEDMSRKRYENWMADLAGQKSKRDAAKRCKKLGDPFCTCSSGFRFKEGGCVSDKMAGQAGLLEKYHGGPGDPSVLLVRFEQLKWGVTSEA